MCYLSPHCHQGKQPRLLTASIRKSTGPCLQVKTRAGIPGPHWSRRPRIRAGSGKTCDWTQARRFISVRRSSARPQAPRCLPTLSRVNSSGGAGTGAPASAPNRGEPWLLRPGGIPHRQERSVSSTDARSSNPSWDWNGRCSLDAHSPERRGKMSPVHTEKGARCLRRISDRERQEGEAYHAGRTSVPWCSPLEQAF